MVIGSFDDFDDPPVQVDTDPFVVLWTELDNDIAQEFCSQCESRGFSVMIEHVELRELENSYPAFRILVPLSQLERSAAIYESLRIKNLSEKRQKAAA